jgi:stalled ribosome rescue protein Dom34
MNTSEKNQIGVWMDHAQAYFIEYDGINAVIVDAVEAQAVSQLREKGETDDKTRFSPNPQHSSPNEHKKQNIEQEELKVYFKMLEKNLQGYRNILLFGPGTAKDKFLNRIAKNNFLEGKKISVQICDKLTKNQMVAQVEDYFETK